MISSTNDNTLDPEQSWTFDDIVPYLVEYQNTGMLNNKEKQTWKIKIMYTEKLPVLLIAPGYEHGIMKCNF